MPISHKLFLNLDGFNLDHLSAFVVTAVGANLMRQNREVAILTNRKIAGFQKIMCASLIATRSSFVLLWNSHWLVVVNS
jgi:hypothetical protein